MDFGSIPAGATREPEKEPRRKTAYEQADRINAFWAARGRNANACVQEEMIGPKVKHWIIRSDIVNGIAPI